MIYTIENVYIQPASTTNHQIFYQFVPSQPSIIYLQPAPVLSPYKYSQLIQPSIYAPSINENKKASQELSIRKEERIPSPIKRSLTPLTADEQLDLNLAHFGYRRQFVNGDGNCFFTAIASQLIRFNQQDRSFRQALKQRLNLPENIFTNQTQLARLLRKLVCVEWKINDRKYKPYINDANYYDEIKKFRSDKFYSSILGDILPLTISNLFGIHLKIITNLSQCPLINISPEDLPLVTSSRKTLPILTLAYNQENDGHYDIAIEKNLFD